MAFHSVLLPNGLFDPDQLLPLIRREPRRRITPPPEAHVFPSQMGYCRQVFEMTSYLFFLFVFFPLPLLHALKMAAASYQFGDVASIPDRPASQGDQWILKFRHCTFVLYESRQILFPDLAGFYSYNSLFLPCSTAFSGKALFQQRLITVRFALTARV